MSRIKTASAIAPFSNCYTQPDGLRASELVSLRQKHVDLRTGIVSCLGKGNKQRTIPIGRSAAQALELYIATKTLPRAVNLPLFFHRGEPLTRQMLWSIIKHYGALTGLNEISPHTLRHYSEFRTMPSHPGQDS